MTHRIMYLRDRKGQPVGCIAIKVVSALHPDKNKATILYQTSVVNPVDQFDRALARQIALGRVVEKPIAISSHADPTMYDITSSIMKDISTDHDQPTRARLAAKRWLRFGSSV